jgi:hypothetical protein
MLHKHERNPSVFLWVVLQFWTQLKTSNRRLCIYFYLSYAHGFLTKSILNLERFFSMVPPLLSAN